jgi:hypothetical protein
MTVRSQLSSKNRGLHLLRKIVGHSRDAHYDGVKWTMESGQFRYELLDAGNDRVLCSIYLISQIGDGIADTDLIKAAYFDFWCGGYDKAFTESSEEQLRSFYE